MDATKYNLKEAFDKKLTGKARLHYLENYEHDMYSRKGHSGEYTGNHPKYSRGVSMMGNPMNPIKAMDDDLKFMPVEDIAGQGTEGVNMKSNPIFLKEKENTKKQTVGGKRKLGTEGMTFEEKMKFYEKQKVGSKSKPNPKIKMGIGTSTSSIRMGHESPAKKAKYGGNKGDLSRSRRDFEGPSMMKTPAKMGLKSPTKMCHKSPAKMGHKSPAKMGHKSPAKMKGKVTFGRKN